MFEVPREHAHYLGVLSWVLVGVASAAMLFGVMPTSQGLEAALVSFLAILALRYVAWWQGRSE
jgi:hypothetical protein